MVERTTTEAEEGGMVDVEEIGVEGVVMRATSIAMTHKTLTPPVMGTASGSLMSGDRAMQVGKY